MIPLVARPDLAAARPAARAEATPAAAAPGTARPLVRLWEAAALREPSGREGADPGARGGGMPGELEARYGGPLLVPLRDDRPTLVVNFVSTLDGIVALGPGALSGGGLVSGHHEPDRFVMGLLRSLADVVLVGAGTVRGADGSWTPADVHPASAGAFASWRRTMGLAAQPTTMIATARGDVPPDHPGLRDPAVPVVVVTTAAGARRLGRRRLPGHVRVEAAAGRERLVGDDLLAAAGRLGARLVLSEGGPHLLGELVAGDLLDELFLTLAPRLVGRAGPGRLGLVEGVGLGPPLGRWLELASIRASGDHLFLRYRREGERHHGREA